MPSQTYTLFERAMIERKQIVCLYNGYRRELCPIILGHTKEEEKALVFQFAGESSCGLPARGQWKCLFLAKIKNAELRDGRWRAGPKHRQAQTCIKTVDLNVNPESPYSPRRTLAAKRHK